MAQTESLGKLIEVTRECDALQGAYTELWEAYHACPGAPVRPPTPAPGIGDAYRVLGVRPDAEWAAIEGAYKALAKTYHPDRPPDDATKAARMAAITAAYTEARARRGGRDHG